MKTPQGLSDLRQRGRFQPQIPRFYGDLSWQN